MESKFDEAIAKSSLGHHLCRQVLAEAKAISDFCGKKKVDKSDVEFAIKALQEKYDSNHPPRDLLVELASKKNAQQLPPVKPFGLRLPNDRFCQVQPNYSFDPPPEMLPNGDAATSVAQMSRGTPPIVNMVTANVNNGVGHAVQTSGGAPTIMAEGSLNAELVSNLLTERRDDANDEDYD